MKKSCIDVVTFGCAYELNYDGVVQQRRLKEIDGRRCELCGDDIGVNAEGEVFVACNECGFPVCKSCYEYERREGNHVCPQCKTRFKRLKGNNCDHLRHL